MQRKTNLFYSTNQDSNFLTFSNFTEALTGNFLSTDWKVYPSRFLCLYIPKLEEVPEGENKESVKADFIKNYLVAYYENKLAFLRDYYTSKLLSNEMNNFDIEGDVNSLAWLFEAIKKFDEEYEITFIGDVTEFDYKGTYTDTICIIDSSDGYNSNNKVDSFRINVNSEEVIGYENESNVLYGWDSEELVGSPYEETTIKFENDNREYSIYSEYELSESISENNSIRFNVIIPLFDITDINYQTNFTDTDNEETNIKENLELKNYHYENGELVKVDIDYSDKEKRSINNPLGIWFADEVIELKRDQNSKYSPSWSLVISSQFKPFPYSNQYHNNDITSKDNQQAFATYAKILAQQSDLSNKLNNISTRLTKIEQLVARLNQTNFETISNKLHDYELLFNLMQEKVDSIDSNIDDKLSLLEKKWK